MAGLRQRLEVRRVKRPGAVEALAVEVVDDAGYPAASALAERMGSQVRAADAPPPGGAVVAASRPAALVGLAAAVLAVLGAVDGGGELGAARLSARLDAHL
jgi:hypothetical protein